VTAKAKKQTYQVMMDIKGQFMIDLAASDLTEALDRAKSLASGERFELMRDATDWNEYEFEVTGVFK